MVSDGRLTRFTELPITVYIEGLKLQGKEYAADFRYALEEWETVSDGLVKFQLVNSPDKANIAVSWVRELDAMEEEHPLGVSELQRTGDDEFHAVFRNQRCRPFPTGRGTSGHTGLGQLSGKCTDRD